MSTGRVSPSGQAHERGCWYRHPIGTACFPDPLDDLILEEENRLPDSFEADEAGPSDKEVAAKGDGFLRRHAVLWLMLACYGCGFAGAISGGQLSVGRLLVAVPLALVAFCGGGVAVLQWLRAQLTPEQRKTLVGWLRS